MTDNGLYVAYIPSEALPLAVPIRLLMMVPVSFSLVILLVLAARSIGLIT